MLYIAAVTVRAEKDIGMPVADNALLWLEWHQQHGKQVSFSMYCANCGLYAMMLLYAAVNRKTSRPQAFAHACFAQHGSCSGCTPQERQGKTKTVPCAPDTVIPVQGHP